MSTNYQTINEQPGGMEPSPFESALPRQPEKSFCDSCQISCLNWTDSCFPWYKWPCRCGLVALLMRKKLLRKFNLLPADEVTPLPIPPAPTRTRDSDAEFPVKFRTATGHFNDVDNAAAGSAGLVFGRNCPSYPPALRRDMIPDPFLVAQKLLARRPSGPDQTYFKPAGAQLNILAAAWIQAMTHDWMDHEHSGTSELSGGEMHGCPMAKFKFQKTTGVAGVNGQPVHRNRRTHWWDVSFVYGSDLDTETRTRTGQGGRIHAGSDGVLDHTPDGVISTGDNKNSWVGVSLLQAIISMEHNAIADLIAAAHPAWTDEEIFRKTRLSTSAIVAKIHTIDWTIELLKNPILKTGMRGNWYGLIGKYLKENSFLGKTGISTISGILGMKKAINCGVSFKLTEEFATVYRLHPMLPDSVKLPEETVSMENLCSVEGENNLRRVGAGPFWEACIRDPCGALVLFNYPTFFRSLPPTTNEGIPLYDARVDLAVLDIYRDRARGVPRFNDMRRSLNMNPIKKWSDLTKDAEAQAALQEVYGNDVDLCDALVGNLAEDKIEGFAISETSFHVFLVMATRRLEADRFFTSDFTPEVYSQEGFDRVTNTESMRDLLLRHFPDIAEQVPVTQSAFKPSGVTG